MVDLNEMYVIALTGNQGDTEALFQVLSERFRVLVEQRIEDRLACEDVVQESLSVIAEKYRGTEFSRSFAAWAYGVLQKKIQNYYRSQRYYRDRFEDRPVQSIGGANPELQTALLNCLRELCNHNMSQARVLNLLFRGFTVRETCVKLGLNANACYIQLSRARAYIRACLKRRQVGL